MEASPYNLESLREDARRVFKIMLEARTADMKFSSLYKAGKITGGCHLGKGHEAIAAAAAFFLRPRYDIYSPFIREQAGRLAFGENILIAAQTYLGSVKGPMRGREGNVHRGNPEEGLLVPISHLGATIAVAVGALLAKRMQGKLPGPIGVAHIGDGTTSTGAFHEAINAAAVENLPLICVITNNQFAYSTPNSREFRCKSLADKAIGYGIEGYEVDGTDFIACIKLMRTLVEKARQGTGPILVEAKILRLCGHGEHDDAKYITQELKDAPSGRDCLIVAEQLLIEKGWSTEEEIAGWRSEIATNIQSAIAQAQREAAPDPYREDWSTTLYRFEENF